MDEPMDVDLSLDEVGLPAKLTHLRYDLLSPLPSRPSPPFSRLCTLSPLSPKLAGLPSISRPPKARVPQLRRVSHFSPVPHLLHIPGNDHSLTDTTRSPRVSGRSDGPSRSGRLRTRGTWCGAGWIWIWILRGIWIGRWIRWVGWCSPLALIGARIPSTTL